MSGSLLPFVDVSSGSSESQSALLTLLEQGQVVALPTETCYGLAVRADSPRALQALADLKGREASQTFTWHVGSAQAVLQGTPWPALTQRLTETFWPGPLTLVMPMQAQRAKELGLHAILQEGNVGVRLPRHAATQELLKQASFPVVMSSANKGGQTPLTEAEQVHATFGASIAAIADGGACELGGSSTILALNPGRFELLRSGRIALEDLQAAAGLRLLFVCTGNTCRSPMAEGIARSRIAQALGAGEDELASFGFHVASAGVYANLGSPVSIESAQVLSEWNMDIAEHRSTPSAVAIGRGVDQIFCLTESHLAALRSTLPANASKALQLLDPAGYDIPDPIGESAAIYRQTRDAIAAAIDRRMAQWV